MAQPIYPKGFTKLKKVYSGKVTGKPRGLLPLDGEDASEFFYVHTILRTLTLPEELLTTLYFRGSWTIQVTKREIKLEDPLLFDDLAFEQSVSWGVNVQGGFGGVLAQWQPQDMGKVRTRICDGEAVPQALEAQNPSRTPPPTNAPADPGYPAIFHVRTTALRVKIPPLPTRAQTLRLYATANAGIPPEGTWQMLRDNLTGGEEIDIDGSAVGTNSSGRIWVYVEAVGGGGVTAGAAVRDTDIEIGYVSDTQTGKASTQQTAGYKGYLYAADTRATPYFETSNYDINRDETGGSYTINIGTDWVGGAYRCRIPDGAYLRIISDYWVGRISANDIYYSISYKPAARAGLCIAQDGRVGERWYFYVREARVHCSLSAKAGGWAATPADAVVVDASPSAMSSHRFGATLLFLYEVSGKTSLTVSYDDGALWRAPQMILDGYDLLGTQLSDDAGTIYLYLRSQKTRDGQEVPAPKRIVQGSLCRALVHLQADGSAKLGDVERVQGDVADYGRNVTLQRSGNTFFLIGESGGILTVHRSTDELSTLHEIK